MFTTRAALTFGGSLAEEWDDLAARSGATPFQRPGWFAAWWDAFGAGEPHVVTVRRSGALVAVMPVMRRGGVLASLANWHSFSCAPVVADAEAAAELVERVLAQARLSVEFSHLMPADSDLVAGIAAAGRHHVRATTVQRSPYVPAGQGFTEYCAGREARRLRQLERGRTRLGESGPVTFSVHEGFAALDRPLDDLLRVEGLGWKAESGTAITSRPETHRFYRGMTAWAAGAGILRIPLLEVGGKAVAGELDLDDGRRVYSLKAGFDPAHRANAPGLLVQLDTIRYALDRGRGYEMLGSNEPYKMRWADEVHHLRRLRIHRATPAGRIARRADEVRRAARHCLRRGRELISTTR